MSKQPWIYSDKVKQHFLRPKNFLVGDEANYNFDSRGIAGNPICGDEMIIYLKIRNDKNTVEFFFSEDHGKTFTKIGTGLDVCGFHANTFGGYSSLKPGLSCTREGKATFRNFRYTPLTKD